MKIRCQLENFSGLVNGVQFEAMSDGTWIAEATASQAEIFLAIPGYSGVADEDTPTPIAGEAPIAGKDETRKRRGRPPKNP